MKTGSLESESPLMGENALPFGELPEAIDVLLEFGPQGSTEKELIRTIGPPALIFNATGEFLLEPIILHLKGLGYPLESSMISYYSHIGELNVYCGNDPLPMSVTIPILELDENRLRLLCRAAIRNEFGTVLSIGSSPPVKIKHEEQHRTTKVSRRTKERKIGYIIEKVSKWRKLYNGVQNSAGEIIKLTLEEAANRVMISKKSLDDYLLQIRFGRKFGFNFQEHKDDKVGVLRAFVKKYKALQPQIRKLEQGETIPSDVMNKLYEPGTTACKHNKCCIPQAVLMTMSSGPQSGQPRY
mmetsp:Transcript_14893/g.27527  ORF Transcript_14893/g.27527 Transcript_14893/m.27527 type:complete len:298 (+) Transcript_14893:1345-2238(+)